MADGDVQLGSRDQREPGADKNALPVAVPEHLLGALGAVVVVFDVATSRIRYVSAQVEDLLGYRSEQILEDPELLRRAVHPDDGQRVVRALSALLRDKADQRRQLRMITAGGREVWVDGVVTVVREDGRPRYAVGVFFDITDRKRLEQALRDQLEERIRQRTARQAARLAQSIAERNRLDAERRSTQARFEAFAANAIEAIVIATDDGTIATVNRRAEEMFARPASEMIGKPLTFLIASRYHGAYRQAFARYQKTGDPRLLRRTVELAAVRADGAEIPVEVSLSSFPAPDGRPQFIGLLRDITERKEAEADLRRTNEELERARREAEAATRAKSEFLANMSHDIRTPMNGIIGMAELLSYTEMSPRQREYVEMVRASADSLLHLLNDILDFSKIEAGKLELAPAELSLHDALGEMLHPFSVQAAARGIELAYHVSRDVPDVLVGDVDRLRQVVSNLVGNAMKFTERGEIVVDANVAERQEESVLLHVTVRDTGIGIPPEKQRRIFEAFRQGIRGDGARPEGTGLGLTIAATVVAMMGGRIWVESEPGVGSTFHFTARLQIGRERERPPRGAESLVGLRILIVDDNEVNRLMLEENLARWGAHPLTVASKQAALEALDDFTREGGRFDLILVDSILAGGSGTEVARAVRARPQYAETPILILSSAGEPLGAEEQRELRIARVLTKPLRRAQLLDAVGEALGAESEETPEERAPLVAPMRVLVVDDNRINQRITAELLRRRGHHVEVAEDGRRALELLETERFACVLMDVEMPVMDGLEATAALRERERETGAHIPVIAMTAYAMKGDRERTLDAGMDGYIAKPTRPAELYAAVERFGARPPGDGSAFGPARAQHTAPELDLEAALERTGGSMDLLRELASMFVERCPAMLEELREAVATKDGPTLRRAAHTLKGSIALFGASEAARLAAELEQMGREGIEANAEQLEALERALTRVERALLQIIEHDPVAS